MKIWLRLPIVLIILFSASSFVWFLLGATANFQRGMDIIGTIYLWGAGIPVLLVGIVFTVLLINGWTPTSRSGYVGACVWLVLTILTSSALIQSVETHDSLPS